MTLYYLGIGSNDQAEESCQKMIRALRARFGSLAVSSLVRTKAVGPEAADYLNGVICLQTPMVYDELKQWCKSLENELGRVRGEPGCRADLDILLAVDQQEQTTAHESAFYELIEHHVTEHYYLSLLKQLILFQRKENIKPLSGSVALELEENEVIGLTPAELQSSTASYA